MAIILGIESSCDESAAALIGSDRTVLAHRLAGQEEAHKPYGGVVPEIAARAHVQVLTPLIEAALKDAGLALDDVDAIAATAGPGLIGGVMVGLVTAKALAMAAGKPLIAVNHLEGHALSPRLADASLEFPYLLLLVSGGHCQILCVDGVGQYRRLATTIDDAAGEAFDKTAKILGLGYPGGPRVEALAKQGDPKAVPLPRPLLGSAEPHFSFAGLKSAVLRAAQSGAHRPEDIAAGFQQAVVDCLVDRLERALSQSSSTHSPFVPSEVEGRDRKGSRMRPSTSLGNAENVETAFAGATPGKPKTLVVAGGVAANGAIRSALEALAARHAMGFVAPPLWLCTDNAAMIGWAGAERFALGLTDPLDIAARPRWPLDPEAEAARGAGVKA
ncbi:tRNA (adenosine(37)-N6)-threonylcarbamoyltransferase complex transferase subunit TsaD [Sphingomonas ursincola]|uniref:tRNA (adenosine(37)-N6)-threonylcarbamoyltransferase complex transferase subunit TsaD n=1 Tax=Sphingomonas ursincola TaxID=56361 RepID=UPI00235571F0|nr:tRNA (adenosine(37)-N6)-threonylcarbamoyltransferase complex transferase subunit TsaD [Sphingomonas ursincola]MBY0620263.1 tRNA (adenosine(37)-N6)-threonylcarbamoyltransferase complex transferase subunit TsaD [Sphingomonas ursincola]